MASFNSYVKLPEFTSAFLVVQPPFLYRWNHHIYWLSYVTVPEGNPLNARFVSSFEHGVLTGCRFRAGTAAAEKWGIAWMAGAVLGKVPDFASRIRVFFSFRSYPMVIKHGTLKTSTNGSFNGKIMDIWSVFNGQVWLLDGVSRERTDELQSDYSVQLWSCSFTVGNQPAGSSPFCGCVVRRRSLVFFGGV